MATGFSHEEELELEQRELAELYNAELIPGTEIMRDLPDVRFIRGSNGQVLVPQPHNHPNDPLNWTIFWKLITVVGVMLVTMISAFGPLSISPQVDYYMEEWDRSLADVLQFSGVCILVLGFSNFLWIPIATRFGRRPALLLSTLLGIGANIWRARATSYQSFIGASAVHGVAAGPSETFGPLMIADVIFLHDRGRYMGIYLWGYMGMLMIGPTVAGRMTELYGWRSFWWLNTALYAFLLVFLMIVPETKWNRNAPDDFYTGGEKASGPASSDEQRSQNPSNNKTEVDVMDAPNKEDFPSPVDESARSADPAAIEHHDTYLGKGKPCRDQFSFYPKVARGYDEDIKRLILVPFELFAYPIVEWAAFVYSFSASSFLVVNLTAAQVFSAEPYNMTAGQIGYLNFGTWVGACFGLVTSGPLSDWLSMRATTRNNGIREPEMRLPTIIPYTLLLIVGSTIVAVGYENQWRWEVIVIVGYAFLGAQTASLPTIALTYAIDSYKPAAGDILLNVTINKNLWGYGVSKFLTSWILSSGFVPPIITILALNIAVMLPGIPLYFYGKKVRKWSKNSHLHKM
ncbi:MFS transporter-like protein [Myxozyma melibiosi]|uniref:MFS transporter-like protein n=1 Tax=Myxozyma melibiosi TaxID=54550 RepID=A0ABR1F3Z4_9ASCO